MVKIFVEFNLTGKEEKTYVANKKRIDEILRMMMSSEISMAMFLDGELENEKENKTGELDAKQEIKQVDNENKTEK